MCYVCMYLICMWCVAGPGEELKIDDEVFITKLRQLLDNLPSSFPHWHLVLGTISYIHTYILYNIHTYVYFNTLLTLFIYLDTVCIHT